MCAWGMMTVKSVIQDSQFIKCTNVLVSTTHKRPHQILKTYFFSLLSTTFLCGFPSLQEGILVQVGLMCTLHNYTFLCIIILGTCLIMRLIVMLYKLHIFH